MPQINFDHIKRTPWNNLIYPGNYVTHLNAYRDQGVKAIPGFNFFRSVGAIVLNPDVHNLLVNGELPAGDYTPMILSPDMRRDDQPRRDRQQVIPAGAIIYRTSLSAPGVREATAAGTATIEFGAPAAPATPVLKANDETTDTSYYAGDPEGDDAASPYEKLTGKLGYFNPQGISSLGVSLVDGAPLATDTIVSITTDAALIAHLEKSAGACRNSPSAIISEVCYFMEDAGPDADDLHLPYAVEAGSSGN